MILKVFLIFIMMLSFGGIRCGGGHSLREAASFLEGSTTSSEARREQSRSRDRSGSRTRNQTEEKEDWENQVDEEEPEAPEGSADRSESQAEEAEDKEVDYIYWRNVRGHREGSEWWKAVLGNRDYDVLLQNALDYARWRKPILEKEIKEFKSGLTPKQRDFFSDSENLSYLQMRTKKAREWAINTKHQLGLTPEQIKQVHRYLDYQRPELGRLRADIPKMQKERNDRN